MYYLRTLPAVNPIQFGIDITDVLRLTGKTNVVELMTNHKTTTENKPTIENKPIGCKIRGGNPVEGCLMCSS